MYSNINLTSHIRAHTHTHIHISIYICTKHKHKHTGRRLLGNALTTSVTSVTTLRSLRGRGIMASPTTKLSTRLSDRRGRRSGNAALEDSAVCTRNGFTCDEILSKGTSGGWGTPGTDAETVCSTLRCTSTGEDYNKLASEACPYTCAKAISETYWTSYGKCMSGLAKEEQCLKCPGDLFACRIL